MVWILVVGLCRRLNGVQGFAVVSPSRIGVPYSSARVLLSSTESNDNDDDTADWKHPIGDGMLDAGETQGTADLSWRVAKVRLEEQNIARFLKARPRFLPYEDCRKWVQAWSRWETKEDWRHWISLGEKRNSYIPSNPDEYYEQTGDWRGWAHFLGMNEDDQEVNEFQ
jgi:hypothetical protein